MEGYLGGTEAVERKFARYGIGRSAACILTIERLSLMEHVRRKLCRIFGNNALCLNKFIACCHSWCILHSFLSYEISGQSELCRDEGKLTTRSFNSPFALSSLVSVSRIIFSDSSIIRFYVCNRHQSSRIKRQIVKIYHILDIPFFCTISDKSSQFPSQIYNFFAIERHLLVIPSPKCQSSHIRLIVVCPLTVGQHQP